MKKKVNTSLPKGYLSWSQIDLVERDPDEYVRRYIYGEQQEENDYMRFGTKTHKTLSRGKPDVGIECILTRKGKELRVIGFLDDVEDGVDVEYKTATKLWTMQRAKEHGQMKLYSLIRYKTTGKIPKQRLVCHETLNLGGVGLTGKSLSFDIEYKLVDLLEMEGRVWRAHDKILALVEQELNNIFK